MTTIGIFGGSFDPPHDGHVYVADKIMKFLQLRQVWWLVTDRNFLKQSCERTLQEREELVCKKISGRRDMRVVSVNSPYAYEAILLLMSRNPHYRFVWIAGSDILETIHLWYRWRDFLKMVSIVVLERPGHVYGTLRKPATLSVPRISPLSKKSLYGCKGWGIFRFRTCELSSSKIRSTNNPS
ncbi:nucleotidyl transferase family protein [Anaplasma bovis]|uniref:nicotinate-nicotinamide nucleotide adenylyltransferase n=1 Tax=Anaplasma bovis TaxID=186733 RepID=UPI002FF0D7AC